MTLVIDIYDRYQDITNLVALKGSPFDGAYVKGSDGGSPAIVRADNFVGALKSIGLPVGLYHYAQLSPSPEVQANVLAQEVRRLGAFGFPPALDLEDPFRPNAQAREFARRFLLELRRVGFGSVVLYANTSMLTGIQAWTIDVPGLRIWAASYGGNDADYDQEDRDRLARAYPHPVWMHQYSSTGSVPGIPGNVDKNWLFDNPTGDDMPLTDDDVNFLRDRMLIQVFTQEGEYARKPDGSLYQVSLGEILGRNNQAGWGAVMKADALAGELAVARGQLTGLTEAVRLLAEGRDIDLTAIEEAAERGAQRGVETATVDVDVSIAGRPVFATPDGPAPQAVQLRGESQSDHA